MVAEEMEISQTDHGPQHKMMGAEGEQGLPCPEFAHCKESSAIFF